MLSGHSINSINEETVIIGGDEVDNDGDEEAISSHGNDWLLALLLWLTM